MNVKRQDLSTLTSAHHNARRSRSLIDQKATTKFQQNRHDFTCITYITAAELRGKEDYVAILVMD